MGEIVYSHNIDTNVVRIVLNRRAIAPGSKYDMWNKTKDGSHIVKYDVNNFANSWFSDTEVDPEITYERRIAKRFIFAAEDYTFINGVDGYDGLVHSTTVRKSLKSAIEEFDPAFIITSSHFLNPEGYNVLRCPYVPRYEHYLLPKKSDAAEFVVADPLEEAKAFLTLDQDAGKQRWLHFVNERAAIEIHDTDTYAVEVKWE